MRHVLTVLLGAIVVALAAHLAVVVARPGLIVTAYPPAIARIYLGKAQAAQRQATVQLTAVEGRPGISRVVLTPGAVQHLGIETATIEARPVARMRSIGARITAGSGLPVEAPLAARSGALVAVIPLSGKSDMPAPSEPARVFPMTASEELGPPLRAMLAGVAGGGTVNGIEKEGHAYYVLDPAAKGPEPGALVKVEMPLVGTGAVASVVPEAAVIYEPTGTAWVYANPEPNAFVREAVQIEASHAGVSVLAKGPPPGTRIVTVGVFEIYGAESSIGIEKVGN